jgi:hypothetical protein
MVLSACRLLCVGLVGLSLFGATSAKAEPAAADAAASGDRPSADFASVVACHGLMKLVRVALEARQNGLPIEAAYGSAEPYRSTPPSYRFLISAINRAYGDPQSVQAALEDGRLRRMCFAQIRRD